MNRRARPRRPATQRETGLQASLADYALRRGALVIRINSGAMRAPGYWANRWRAPGQDDWRTKGASDLLVIYRGRILVVEAKMPDNGPTEDQGDFLEAAEAAGAVPVVAYSLDDLMAAMEG